MAFTKAKPSKNRTIDKIPVMINGRQFTIFKVQTAKGARYKFQNGKVLYTTADAARRALIRHLS
jgi:hypothetical protein